MSNITFETYRAIDFCDDVRDGTHDSPKHLDYGKILITSKNIKGDSIDFANASYISEGDYNKINERSLVEKNDILYSMIGTIGLVYRVDKKPDYAIKNMGLFKISDELKSKWLYYYLTTPKAKEEVLSKLNGSTQKFISLSNLRNLNVIFPVERVDAEKIVRILESIDIKIKLNNKINNNLYEIVSQLYQSLFDNGEWEKIELKDVANVSSGKRPKKKLEKGAYPIVGANGIMGFTSDYNLDNDIIITGRVGTLGIVKSYYGKVWASDNTLIIKTKYNSFVENYLKTVDYFSLNRGSTQPLLTQSDLKSQKLLFNKEIVGNFELKVKKIIEKIRNNDKENEALSKLRDTLLPKLMNGEIDLENVEI